MGYKSKGECYIYSIFELEKLSQNSNLEIKFKEVIDKIKILFENHEQDLNVLIGILQNFIELNPLDDESEKKLESVLQNIELSIYYQQTLEEKFQNILARRYESQIALEFLLHPTALMLSAVQKISARIIKIIEEMGEEFDEYLPLFMEPAEVIAFGAYRYLPSKENIIKVLKDNYPDKLPEIIHIHYKFARNLLAKQPLRHAEYQPIGKVKEILERHWRGGIEGFKEAIALDNSKGESARVFVANKVIFSSPLYNSPTNRGRLNAIEKVFTNEMGLMLNSQKLHSRGLGTHQSTWVADCKAQAPNFESPYVLDMLMNDAVYVSGPSGMASVYLGMIEVFGELNDDKMKKSYLLAIMSYIVGGGFHSIHEVIGPAQYSLHLIPNYNIDAPSLEKYPSPPNYYEFFSQQMEIDPEFAKRREKAWDKFMHYFKKVYNPRRDLPKLAEPSMLSEAAINLGQPCLGFFKPDDKEEPQSAGDKDPHHKP